MTRTRREPNRELAGLRFGLALVLVALCGCEEEGAFEVEFDWGAEGPPPEGETLFVSGRVEDRFDDGGDGRILASAGPEAWQSGLSLAFDSVPLGSRRRVVVELREQAGSAAPVVYYGVSEPFDLRAGERVTVEVNMTLTAVPGRGHHDGAAQTGVSAVVEGPRGIARQPEVRLRVVTEAAVAVELSNLADLPADATERVPLEDGTPLAGTGASEFFLDWDLDRGLPEPCGVQNDCQRQVFARLVDARGYRSSVYEVPVVVDSRPPGLLDETVQVQLLPASGNPLATPQLSTFVESVTSGTRVRLGFSLDEPSIEPPVVAAKGQGDMALRFERQGGEAYPESGLTFFSYEAVFEASAPIADASLELTVTAVDKAGTEATRTLPVTLRVDTVAPDSPRPPQGDEPTLVYARSPWGDADDPQPRYSVRAAEGSFEPGALVQVLSAADPAVAEILATGQADEAGGLPPVVLERSDRARLYVRAIDAAGNVAERASLVRDVEWTASFSGREAGRADQSNPHVFERRRFWLPQLHQADAEPLDGEAVRAPEGESVAVVGSGRWQRMKAGGVQPDPRIWAAMALDRARGQLVMYGGSAYDGRCDDDVGGACSGPQEWSGHGWQRRQISGERPSPRDGLSMTWDGVRGHALLFGGKSAVGGCGSETEFCSDLWAYDGQTFSRLHAGAQDASGPVARDGASLVYDWERGVSVLFGGYTPEQSEDCPEGLCDDTWEWDGERWTRTVAGAGGGVRAPNARNRHAAAFDEARGELVVFGGTAPPALFGDTWVYSDGSWRHVVPPADAPPQPSGRKDATLTYSARLGRVVLFGGEAGFLCDDGADRWCNGLWSWTGTHWERVEETGADLPDPVGRSRAVMSQDAFGNLLVFGGQREAPGGDCDVQAGRSYACRGLWVWEGGHWRERSGVTGQQLAANRYGHAAAYDEASGYTYVAGGRRGVPSECLDTPAGGAIDRHDDLWRWDGSAWQPVVEAGDAGSREGAALVAAEGGPPTLLGGAAAHYTALRSTGSDACDEDFARSYFDESFELEGELWLDSPADLANEPGARPLARRDHAVAHLGDGSLVLLGGRRACADLADAWAHDDGGWRRLDTGVALPARNSAAAAYNEALDQLLVFGGASFFDGDSQQAFDAGCTSCRCVHGEVHVYEDGAFHALGDLDDGVPRARAEAAAAYVPGRETVLLTGGVAANDCGGGQRRCDDLWEWDGARWWPVSPTDPEGDGDPAGREQHILVHDRARGELVLFGGTQDAGDGTWLWHPAASRRPGQVARFDFAAAQAPDATLRSVELAWEATGDSPAGAEVALRVWRQGRFVEASQAGFAKQGTRWQASSTDDLATLPTGERRILAFAMLPAADNGAHPGYGRLSSDFVELRVDYRLPPEP